MSAVAAPSGRLCFRCKVPILGDSVLKYQDYYFHKDHFNCGICQKDLRKEGFWFKDDDLYCREHFEQKFCPKCRTCDTTIVGGKIVRAIGFIYHAECFKCAVCSKLLEAKYRTDGQYAYCEEHVPAPGSSPPPKPPAATYDPPALGPTSKSLPSAPISPSTGAALGDGTSCESCKNTIAAKDLVKAGTKHYHRACLVCSHCKILLTKAEGRVFKKDDKLYCKKDYELFHANLCTTCAKPILEDAVYVKNGEYYHSECFKCSVCEKKLSMYLSLAGELRCSDHTSASGIPLQCATCSLDVPIDKIVKALGKKYHSECLICSKCKLRNERPNLRIGKDGELTCSSCLLAESAPEADDPPLSPVGSGHRSRISVADLTPQTVVSAGIPGVDSPTGGRPIRVRKSSQDMEIEKKAALPPIPGTASAGSPVSPEPSPAGVMTSPVPTTPTVVIPPTPESPKAAADDKSEGKKSPELKPSGSRKRAPTVELEKKEHSSFEKSMRLGSTQKWLKAWKRGELIGKGQFGKVYSGFLENGQVVAVKQLELKGSEDYLTSLETEVRLMENLKHENIVQLLGTVRDDKHLNIFMEFVPGKSLDVHLKNFGAFTEITIKWYTIQLLRALHYMHSKGMAHRDLKGKNVLVDTSGNVKLADFGSAKQFENTLGTDSPSVGYNYTPLWTAPEVISSSMYNSKVDIWSLGCVMIEMATAKLPWDECKFENPFRALFHIGNSGKIPEIPSHLSSTCKDFMTKCLTRDPELRPSAEELMSHPFMEMTGPEEDEAALEDYDPTKPEGAVIEYTSDEES